MANKDASKKKLKESIQGIQKLAPKELHTGSLDGVGNVSPQNLKPQKPASTPQNDSGQISNADNSGSFVFRAKLMILKLFLTRRLSVYLTTIPQQLFLFATRGKIIHVECGSLKYNASLNSRLNQGQILFTNVFLRYLIVLEHVMRKHSPLLRKNQCF